MDTFNIKVLYNGHTYEFEPVFTSSAYTYRFVVMLDDREIYFEPDEERQLRAVSSPGSDLTTKQVELVKLIGAELQKVFDL